MSHFSRKHKNVQDELDSNDQQVLPSIPGEQNGNMMDNNLHDENNEGDSFVSEQNLEKTAALFLLTMKEKF